MVFKKILIPVLLNILIFTGLWYWLQAQHRDLADPQYILGWTLLALSLFMSMYSLRKKLSVLPLGKNSSWYLLHLYVGIWCLILFGFHSNWKLPGGLINQALWLGFVLIIISGFLGFLLNKYLAPSVSSHGERLIFNRIPEYINRNREEAITIIQGAAGSENGKPLFDFYNKELKKVFFHDGHLWHKIFGHRKQLLKMLIQLEELERYLDDENKERLLKLKVLIKQKYQLSWQYSTLSILRNWPVLHVPVIWFTLIILLIHIISQYAFQLRTPW